VVRRKIEEGYNIDGKVQLVIKFSLNVIINDKGNGIDFWSDLNEPVKGRKDIFVLNFTVKES